MTSAFGELRSEAPACPHCSTEHKDRVYEQHLPFDGAEWTTSCDHCGEDFKVRMQATYFFRMAKAP